MKGFFCGVFNSVFLGLFCIALLIAAKNVIAVDTGTATALVCTDSGACGFQMYLCYVNNNNCTPPPGHHIDQCVCAAKYKVAPNACGCGDWFLR